MSSSHDAGCCHGNVAVRSVHQTLSEMEFERGIWSAALDNDMSKVKSYLTGGGDVNAQDNSGYTALHYAARYGHTGMCRLLLDNHAKVNSVTRSGQATPLHRAAYCGHAETTALLMQRGADILLQDADDMTSLHKACEKGHKQIAEMLVGKDKNLLNMKDNKGRLPVDLIQSNRTDLMGWVQSLTS